MDARRRLLGLSLVLATVAITPAVAHAHGPVYVLSAAKLTVTQRDGQNATVRLSDPTKQATHFSASGRAHGGTTTKRLVAQWRRLGFDGRPLATIDPAGDRRQATLVRLGRPRLVDGGRALVASVRVADGAGGPLANRLVDRADALPSSAEATTLSIDAAGVDADPAPGGWVKVHLVGELSSLACGHTPFVGREACGYAPYSVSPPWGETRTPPVLAITWADGELVIWSGDTETKASKSVLLRGSMSADRTTYLVTDGWMVSRPNTVHSGTDPALSGDQGGPLTLTLVRLPDPAKGVQGWKLTVDGSVWKDAPPA